jgi:iron complex outermembrane recepter protein
MTLKTNTLRDAITFALAAGTTALVGTGAAYAQDSDKEGQELDRVTVIGSRIPRAAETEGTAPVLVLDRTAIEQTGLTSVGDVLFNLTASDGGALRNITTSTNGSDGTQNISLRGLGAQRTLVLVNGRRWVSQGGGVVDLNTIPIAVVERIEVLKDGASAIYGSDAIAGVINIITRTNFDGAEASVYMGSYTKGDGFQEAYDFTIGADSDRWNAVVGLSYTKNDPVFAGDREQSEVPVFGGGQIQSGGAFGSGSPPFARLRGTGIATNARLREGEDGRQASDFRPWVSSTFDGSGSSDRYNFAPVNYLVQPIERFSLYTQGSVRITDRINASVQAVYVKRDSDQQLAEVPATMDTTNANGPQWNFAPTAGNVFNPFGTNLTGAFMRMIAVGPRKPNYDNDNIAITGSLDGSFDLAGRAMYWDAGYSFLNSRITSRGENYINLFNLRRAVGNSRRNPVTGALECLDASNAVIGGCVPFNVFGGPDLGLGAGVINRAEYDAMLNYVSYTQNNFQENTTKDFFANLSGEIVELPAGPLGFAVGLERRKDDFVNQPDALVAGGGSSDNFTLPTRGVVTVDEYYAELNVPILADIPGFKLLELNLATRGSDYSAEGVEARVNQFTGAQIINDRSSSYDDTSSKIGLKWQVFDDLMLRGTYSESFRAPSVVDLYQGEGEGFPIATDPCSTRGWGTANAATRAQCVAGYSNPALGISIPGVAVGGSTQPNAQIRSLGGGNANLLPESGTTKSFGVVYSPSWLEGLNITLDYYKIELEDVITTRTANNVMSLCYNPGSLLSNFSTFQQQRDVFCPLVSRQGNGDLNTVNLRPFNLDSGEVEGYDLAVGYALPENSWGKFSFQWDTNYQVENNLFGEVGEYNGSPTWRVRSNLTSSWRKGDWDASWSMRYYSKLIEDCSSYANAFEYGLTEAELCNNERNIIDENGNPLTQLRNDIGSRIYHDVQVGLKLPWNAKIVGGARNIFAKDPPTTRNSFAHSFDAAYDLPGGGFWYLQYNQKF